MGLKDILSAVGEGALQNHNVKTLGPDWRLQIEAALAKRRAEQRAMELHKFEVGDQAAEVQQRELTKRAQVLQADSTPGLGGDSPSDVGPTQVSLSDEEKRARLAAKLSGDATAREAESHDAQMRTASATARNAELKPTFDAEKLEIQKQQALLAIERAGNQAQLAQAKLQLQQAQFGLDKLAEQRRSDLQDNKPYVNAGAADRIAKLAELRSGAKDVVATVGKIANKLGPVAGRITLAQLTKAGGYGLTPDEIQALVNMGTLIKTETFSRAGMAVAKHEGDLAQRNVPMESELLSVVLQKANNLVRISERDLQRRVGLMSPYEQRQIRNQLEMEGLWDDSFGAGAPHATTTSPNGEEGGMAPPSDRTRPPQGQGATKRMRWDGTRMVPVS